MASGWHKLTRIFRADWKEIRTRGGQELHKRADLLRYRIGGTSGSIQIPQGKSAGEGSERKANFFFAPGNGVACAELVEKHLPDQAEAIIREANEICQHRFRLLGYENLDYGIGIDWHLDRVHGKRAPLAPWFKIPFLDFAVVGDHKVTWELNRHQHLVTLAKAWLLTKDEKYIRELIAQLLSWSKSNPYPLGINWGSSLEVAFRSLSWIWVDQLLAGAPGYSEFRSELLPALAFHGRYIERFLSTYFSPNTHLLGEALALFFIGTLYPQFPRALRWRDEGWAILLHEAQRQVRPDGVYFEQSLYYHVYAVDFFLHARLLAAVNGIKVPAAFDDLVHRMLNVVAALAQAGPAEGFGDDDGGRLFNPRRNRTENMTDPLSLGAVFYDRDLPAARLTEESIWLYGERAVTKLASPGTPAEPVSASLPDGGLYVLAGSSTCPHTMVIDAGPQGTGRCGHGHADALSLRLTMNGTRWLVDSGSGVYVSADPTERNAFRSTAAHNTLRIDGTDQAVPDEPFSWTGIPTTRVENWVAGKTFSYFAGSHNGYERLPGCVTHQRSVLRVNGGRHSLWLVRDSALGTGEHDLEVNWHFATGVQLSEAGNGEFVALQPDAQEAALHLIIPHKMPDQPDWRVSITEGQISPAYGRYEPASILHCAARAKLPAEIATALVEENRVGEAGQNRRRLNMMAVQKAAVQAYELDDADTIHNFFFARNKQPWSASFWSSDAELVYIRSEHDELSQLIVIGGSSVAWHGKPLLNADGPFPFFEWQRESNITTSGREKFSTTPAFDELISTLHCPSSVAHPTSTYAEKP